MNLKILSLFAAVLLVAACQQSQPTTGTNTGTGTQTGTGTSGTGTVQQQARAGGQHDLLRA